FDEGQEIAFSGSAFDPELGPLPPESLHWRVFLNHLNHIHPVILDQVGSGGTFTASFHNEEPQNIHYTITAWATDAFGLRTERSVRIDADPNAPSGTLRVFQVDATDRDATSVAGELKTTGLNSGKPFDYISNNGDPFAAALQFRLDVPQGAAILEANLIVRGGSGQVASPSGALAVRVYDTSDCAPFVDGPGDLETLHPAMPGSVEWASPAEWSDED